MLDDYFEIGKIVNTQGVKGDLRVVPTTDDPKRFELLDEVYVKRRETEILQIEKVWYNKTFVILKFKGIDDMNAAEKYKNAMILIPSEKALPLGDDEYYTRDLYDVSVETVDGEQLGIIKDVIPTGANDVYVIKNADKNIKDLLIPAIKQCIISVDIKNKKMIVNLLEGLRD